MKKISLLLILSVMLIACNQKEDSVNANKEDRFKIISSQEDEVVNIPREIEVIKDTETNCSYVLVTLGVNRASTSAASTTMHSLRCD